MDVMTDRKPAGMSFGSWIDEQIRQAEERGAFDDLPGTGKPLPKRNEDAAQAWLREYMKREGISADELLPTPLKLRKELERLGEDITAFRSEDEIREVVRELNYRIVQFRRFPSGPPVFVPLADTEALVQRWREAQEPPAGSPAPSAPSAAGTGSASRRFARPRWWPRRTLRP
jgi:DnaJ homologue, subfamily C, member 28, conserved domain